MTRIGRAEIVKIFHGADSDIVWLQKDFSIYVVNMFDTGQAARVLQYEWFGLGYLLKRHCNETTDKKYQLADWRIRPLPREMLVYVRKDTHFLLYIADIMHNELVDLKLLRECLDRSRELCLLKFVKPRWTQKSYKTVMRRQNLQLYPEQERIFAALHGWRNVTARRLDEGLGFIMSNDCMAHLAKQSGRGAVMSLASIHQLIESVVPVSRTDVQSLAQVIAEAKNVQQVNLEPAMPEDTTPLAGVETNLHTVDDVAAESNVHPVSNFSTIYQGQEQQRLTIPPLSHEWGGTSPDPARVCHYSKENDSCTSRSEPEHVDFECQLSTRTQQHSPICLDYAYCCVPTRISVRCPERPREPDDDD